MHKADQLIQIDPADPVAIEETMKAGEPRMRRIDVIERWWKSGRIDNRQYAAARQFASTFHMANLQERYALQTFERVDQAPGEEALKVAMAQDEIRQAMYTVGKVGGSVLWDVVGLGWTLDQYCKEHSWTGANAVAASGALICALSALADHWRC